MNKSYKLSDILVVTESDEWYTVSDKQIQRDRRFFEKNLIADYYIRDPYPHEVGDIKSIATDKNENGRARVKVFRTDKDGVRAKVLIYEKDRCKNKTKPKGFG